MNISQAKTQIKNAVSVYFSRDEYENFLIPVHRQRPVFLIGPPGIGKTAIMAQIAGELGIGLLSYSMTHHTRQSALGLPFITRKTYGGIPADVSEYTMSEIIASIYDLMEETGVSSGILFLDEINCVSETLAPAMLQFLQYKTFGRHRIPEGWIVVTAGNPPEYNKSVREFDIVTWDRLKRIDIEPDFDAWKEYAYAEGVHPSIMTYLEIKKSDFYIVESNVGQKEFVTARGWVDLSDMIKLYEQKNIAVDRDLVSQYLQIPIVARNFAAYYDLFVKYRSDYQAQNILEGKASAEIKSRAASAPFDERLALLGLLVDAIAEDMREVKETEQTAACLAGEIQALKSELVRPDAEPLAALEGQMQKLREKISNANRASDLSEDERLAMSHSAAALDKIRADLPEGADGAKIFESCKKYFNNLLAERKKQAANTGKKLESLFTFCEEAYPAGQELAILVTQLTVNKICAGFISAYGSEAYFRLNKSLLLYERNLEIISEIQLLEDLGEL
ncbi:MAG: AAA family ATPase [Oscillospiraceae bacterium]|nr:AAA family ATPase [Oscillospiraceae bacterium]